MKKLFRSSLCVVMVLCLLSTMLFTGNVFVFGEDAVDLREDIITAINGLTVTSDTTAADIEAAVTSVDSDANILWKVDFTKVLPTNGAKITLNGEDVDGGLVRGHDGSIKGIITVAAGDETFDVVVNFTLEPEYETINCTKKAEITNIPANETYTTATGYDPEADLVVINRQRGGWNIPNNYFYENETIKAVIVKPSLAGTGSNAFAKTTALKAVVYTGCRIFNTQAFFGSSVQYVDFGSVSGRELEFQVNAFQYAAVPALYFDGYKQVKIGKNAFGGSLNLKQIVVDLDTVTSVTSGAINTNKNQNASLTTIVCKNAASATKFANAGAAATVDVSKVAIVDYYSAVSKIKVVEEATESDVEAEAKSLDTGNAFTVTAKKNGNIFEVSITDSNSVTITAFLKTLSYSENEADVYANSAQKAIDNLIVDRNTTAEDLMDTVNNAVNDENVEFVWIDPFKKVTPVDSAVIYLDGELIASTDKQDGGIYATIGMTVGKHTRVLFIEKELAAVTERFSYTAADKAPDRAFTIENGVLTGYEGSYKLVIIPNSVSRINVDSPLSTSKHGNLNHGECNCLDLIETVIVHERLSYMDWVTFSGLTNLKVAIIGSGNLAGMNFQSCISLMYVKLHDSMTTMGQAAFRYCTALKSIKLPSKLTTLGENALRESGITDVIIPDTVTTVGNDATTDIVVYGKGESARFADTVKLAKEYFANIPVSLESEEMLSEGLLAITTDFEAKVTSFKRTEASLKATADIIAVKDNKEYVYKVSCDRLIPTHNLDEIVQKIENAANSMNVTNDTTSEDVLSHITAAVGDERVEIIYVQEFDKVRAINGANIYLSGELVGSVPTVDGRITAVLGVKFKGDKATAIIDERITPTIENYRYDSKAPDSAFTIENGTLKSYNGDSELIIVPDTVKKIGVTPFGTTNAETIIIPDTVTNVDWATFGNCKQLKVAILSDKIGKLPGMNFKNCESLKYVKLPSALQRIGEECFFNTYSLETLKIPDTVVYVDRRAFCNSGIYEITLPSTVEVIYDSAFRAQDGSAKHLDKITILSDKVEYNTGKNIEDHKDASAALPIFGYGHEVKLFCRNKSTTEELYNSMTFTDAYKGLTLCEYLDQTYLDAVYAAKSIVSNMYSDTETSSLLKSFIEKEITNKNVSIEIARFKYDKVSISATVNVVTRVNDEEWIVKLTGNKKVLISSYEQLINAAQNTLNKMTVTDETTKEDIEYSVKTAIDSGTAVVKWSVDFAKRKSVHGAVIKVNGQSWDIPGVEGKVAGYINITFKGKNENIKLERVISPEIEILKYNTVSDESEFNIVNDKIFEYNGNAEVIVVPKAETIVSTCFAKKAGIKAVIIPEGMIGLQAQAFMEMPDLEAVYISDSCTNLGISNNKPDHEGAACFKNNEKLKYVRLSPYTTEIPFYTFSNCPAFTEFYIPEGINKIGHRAFFRLENVEDLVLPSTLTKIGSYTFAGNNAEGVVEFDDITVLSDNLEFFVQSPEHPNAGPFACYSNKVVNIHYPKGAKPNYINERLGRYNFKVDTFEVTQTLSQAAIDLQRLLNDYPITNDTTKEVMNAAIDKLITNNQIKYKWTKDYTKVNCDDENAGLATGKILLTDSDTKLTFSVDLNKSISTSTFVDNRTITIYDADPVEDDGWDDEPQVNNPIDVQEENNNSKILLYVIIGAGALLLLTGATIGILFFLKKRKVKK